MITKMINMRAAESLYERNAAKVAELASLNRITSSDIASLHRHIQFVVACDHWSKCDSGARSVLLNSHPHVASAARLSAAAV